MRFVPVLPILLTSLLLADGSLRSQSTTALYDEGTLRTFYFTFASTTWYTDLQSAHANQTNVKGDLRVDGTLYSNVGVRFRGSSSYYRVGRKKSINVTMDAFVSGRS